MNLIYQCSQKKPRTVVLNQGDLAPWGPLGKVWRCLGSHLERKASWHLVGVGTHPSTCRTGPVNRPIHPKPKHREPREARGDHAGAADTPPVARAEGSASLRQGQPRSHRSPVRTQGKRACVHTSHCQPWGAGGVDSQTPGPLLAQGGSRGADGLGMEVGWGGEAGEKVHLSSPPRAHLLLPPALRPPPQTARSPPASRWFSRRT